MLIGLLLLMTAAGCSAAGQGSIPPLVTDTAPTDLAPYGSSPQAEISPTPVPDLPVKVISQAWVTDVNGHLHLVGEIRNEAGQGVEQVNLTLVVTDATAASLLRSDSGEPVPEVVFSPLITRLADGQSAPFDYPLPPGSNMPAEANVFVSGYQPSSAELMALQVENLQIMSTPGGEAVMVGELVNNSPNAVNVLSVAALLRDSNGGPLSAGSAAQGVMPGLLLAAGDANQLDRAPFKIPFSAALPPGATWQVYSDAASGNPAETTAFAIDQASLFYTDARGGAHLISEIKNTSERAFSVQILAGLYGSTGSVMDVSRYILPVDLQPGESIPFDAAGFDLLNGRADQLAKLDHFTIQVDPAQIVPSQRAWVTLQPEGVQAVSDGQGSWTLSGSVTNTTGADLQRIVVIATLKSRSTGILAATSSAVLENPAGAILPGIRMDYSIEVLADPNDRAVLDPGVKVYASGN